jgi:TPR repeat protein
LAERDNSRAQFHLGVMYDKGQGILQDYDEAFKWCQLAEKQAHSSTKPKIYNLAKFKVPAALKILTNNAKNGVANAQTILGEMYEKGQGVPQDFKKAFNLYRLATEQTYNKAQFKTGDMYYKGQGIQKDYVLADKWFIVSSFQENQEAKKYIDKVEKLMSPKQKEKALEMAKEGCLRYCGFAFRRKASLIGQQ